MLVIFHVVGDHIPNLQRWRCGSMVRRLEVERDLIVSGALLESSCTAEHIDAV